MRIEASGKTALGLSFRTPRSSVKYSHDDAPAQTGTTLARTETPTSGTAEQRPLNRPLPTFLAQLIAKSQDMPSTRVRCRIDPAEGNKVYRGIFELGGKPERR